MSAASLRRRKAKDSIGVRLNCLTCRKNSCRRSTRPASRWSWSIAAVPPSRCTWEDEHLPAILQAWYPGEEGGRAVAEVLFGEVNPSGHLPMTFYRATTDLPAFTDYSMANRTYRYFSGKPLYAFGHGLSYTSFDYTAGKLESNKIAPNGTAKVTLGH